MPVVKGSPWLPVGEDTAPEWEEASAVSVLVGGTSRRPPAKAGA